MAKIQNMADINLVMHKTFYGFLAAAYFVMSLFLVGDLVICFHEDGSVFLEDSQELIYDTASLASLVDDHNDQEECPDDNCVDHDLSNIAYASMIAPSLDIPVPDTPQIQISFDLTVASGTLIHKEWQTDPPRHESTHYTGIVKPTLVLQV